jgi:4-oxalocrotonate tautomerase family enzyme
MPNVYIDGPPADVEVKRTLAKDVTDAVAGAYKLPPDAITVVIKENPAENVAHAGCLLCDARADEKE